MSDWDASSGDEAPKKVALAPVRRGKFEDEDVEDDVKDDWGASSDEEDKAAKPSGSSGAAPPAKKKMSFKQKVAEKEAAERRRMELGLAHGQDKEEIDVLEFDPIAARRAERAAQIRADVGNAADLLGVADIGDDEDFDDLPKAPAKKSSGTAAAGAAGAASSSSSSSAPLPAWASASTPRTKAEWDSLAASLYAATLKPHATKDAGGFAKHFVPALTKHLTTSMRDVDVRKLSTSVKGWAEEKTAAEQAAKRSGGNAANLGRSGPAGAAAGAAGGAAKPKTVGTSSAKNTTDLKSYGDEALDDADAYDDDLDFM